MNALGLQETVNSGAGWVDKEDGRNDHILCQLKSTDAQSIRVNQLDIHTLENNAAISHLIPVFAIQFLNTGEVWLMTKPEHLQDIGKYLETGEIKTNRETFLSDEHEELTTTVKKQIKSSKSAREQFHKDRESKYKKEKKAW